VFLLTAYILMVFLVEPFHRMFSLDDRRIQFPHAEVERVPPVWLFVYAIGVPLACLVIWTLIMRPGTHKTHVTFLSLAIRYVDARAIGTRICPNATRHQTAWLTECCSVILTSFLTDLVKNTVGRPRPDLIARCKPAPGTPETTLLYFDVCTETDHHTLQDGWRSFPSGHSSFSFAGLGFLSLFLSGQLRVFRPRVDLFRVLLAFAPFVGAAMIAISRVEDYRHDVWDVTAGSVLGSVMAYTQYRRYYPSLRNDGCEEPYRNIYDSVDGSDGVKAKDRDEEERRRSADEYELDGLVADNEDVPLTRR